MTTNTGDLVEAAEQSLTRALKNLDGSSQNGMPAYAAAVTAAAYALAVARGDVVPAPPITTATLEHHSHGLFG